MSTDTSPATATRMPTAALGERLSPRRVYLRVTRACNAKCSYCPSWQMPRDMPSVERLREIIDGIAAVGTAELRFTGGEVVLHPGAFDLVAHARERGLDVSIITNGTLFARRYFAQAVESGIARVILSLDTPVAQKHDRLRVVKGLFDMGVNGVRRLRELRPGVELEVNMVVSRESVDDMEAAVRHAADLGAEVLNLIPIKDTPDLSPSLAQMVAHNARAGDLAELARDLGVRVTPPDFDLFGRTDDVIARSAAGQYPRRNGCYVPYLEAFVDGVTGLVWPCDSTPYAQRNCATCGDLNEQSFPDIWYGERFERLRRAYRNARPVPCSDRCDPANAVNSDLYQLVVQRRAADRPHHRPAPA